MPQFDRHAVGQNQSELVGPITRFGNLPTALSQPPRSPSQAKLAMMIALRIPGGHVIIGNDAPSHPG